MILTAIVLTLEGPARPDPDGWRGLVYGLLKQIDPNLHSAQPNPFSLSLGGHEGAWWVRVGILQEGLYARLSPHLFGLMGQTVRLKEPFRVMAVLQEEHPWASMSSYPRLFQGQASASLGLQFASPTFFRRKGQSYPLPEPKLVFDSLALRWNAFAPVRVPEELQESWERMTIARFQGHTQAIRPNPDERGVGFVGRVVYYLPAASPVETQWMQALGRFAFYAGVGAKTSLGFGRVRGFDPRQEVQRGGTEGENPASLAEPESAGSGGG